MRSGAEAALKRISRYPAALDQLRRFTRLANGFSKKWENLRAAVALHFAHYNLCRMHSSIRMTPAMKAGVTRAPWSLADLLAC